jgi:hypothetical protein
LALALKATEQALVQHFDALADLVNGSYKLENKLREDAES